MRGRLLVLMGVLLVTSACGSGGGDGAATPTQSSSASSAFIEDLPTTTSRERPVTLHGTLSDGVEAGCLVLTADGAGTTGVWTLVGATAGLRAGQTVTVRGARLTRAATTCQQGTPFRVDEVVPGQYS